MSTTEHAPSDATTAALRQEATNPDHTSADRNLFAAAWGADVTLRAAGREWEAYTVAQLALRLRDALRSPFLRPPG